MFLTRNRRGPIVSHESELVVTPSHFDEGDEGDGKMARALAHRFIATDVGRKAKKALKKENEKGRTTATTMFWWEIKTMRSVR